MDMRTGINLTGFQVSGRGAQRPFGGFRLGCWVLEQSPAMEDLHMFHFNHKKMEVITQIIQCISTWVWNWKSTGLYHQKLDITRVWMKWVVKWFHSICSNEVVTAASSPPATPAAHVAPAHAPAPHAAPHAKKKAAWPVHPLAPWA